MLGYVRIWQPLLCYPAKEDRTDLREPIQSGGHQWQQSG